MEGSSDQLSDRTLPDGGYYRDGEAQPGIDLQARRQEIEDLVYEDETTSSMSGVEDRLVVTEDPPLRLLSRVPVPAPFHAARPSLGPFPVMVQSQEVHHHYQQIADDPALAALERARRDEQIIAQAAELARVSVKNESMQSAGLALQEELKGLDKPEKSKRCGWHRLRPSKYFGSWNLKLPNYCAVTGSVKLRWNARAWRGLSLLRLR
ncbi:hypothetical protein H310_08455 [Aphanomyces invadans]|uniref:Uncharacterized protein n=1 Tax=Aphanomyces invadans TaxID=157072 RepID=A0A024U070_9STRA|nr:hypothetical protein H310_08455 [Aphanomyces invadans]ETV98982.1 hypothetical protein H310_08455 [Aphanomyces invadans]|eukprot:XP_008872410.1 hypothetical protein H310_08455 [Aphanomyces invadans]